MSNAKAITLYARSVIARTFHDLRRSRSALPNRSRAARRATSTRKTAGGWQRKLLDLSASGASKWPGAESNCRHADFQSAALPTELPGRAMQEKNLAGSGGAWQWECCHWLPLEPLCYSLGEIRFVVPSPPLRASATAPPPPTAAA